MFVFIAPNENINEAEKTFVDVDAAVGATTMTVERASDYAANQVLRLGRRGKEKTELRTIQSISGNVITFTAATTYEHLKGDEVVRLRYNQRKLYKETSAGSGSYEAVTGITNPKAIEIDNPDGTIFELTDGSAGLRYKATYVDSIGVTESDIDDAEAVYGGDSGSYCSIFNVRSEAGFEDNPNINDGEILRERKSATDEVNSFLKRLYVLPLSYVPDLISDITCKLAAGRLLQKNYAGIEPMYERIGKIKLQEGRELLEKITSRKIVLLDADQNQLSRISTSRVEGWPDSTTKDATLENSGGDVKFRSMMEF